MDWVRGQFLGRGNFATVNLATHIKHSLNFSCITAVKSSEEYTSHFLQKEKHILDRLGSSPYIIKCFGHDHTFEDDQECYNIFLEYAVGGTLFDQLKNHGDKFSETLVRRYTRSIVEGLKHIHESGFVHCDVKLQNILVFDQGNVKISYFGLAKVEGLEHGEKKLKCRVTPIFMVPESINDSIYESPVDIWALGCAVVEMITGKPTWNMSSKANMWSLKIHIGIGEELPLIPNELSEEGKDFLNKCFVKDPLKRSSLEMLLKHPFISDDETLLSLKGLINKSQLPLMSPRTHLDYSQWASCEDFTDEDSNNLLRCYRSKAVRLVSKLEF
ncbi:mitogen-activated protein kinase kinase kinase 20-like [Lathyrus oleraceus]|uniref:mitogen-activated protein kinase kinase kinase 20-like n=1 Tax=Pisum sativum TaxID=3888 RepID=UPI0021D0D3AB|nr:mitogen-activated protein kinase kinase kinase 20-like [Pisum sativum]